MSVPSAPADTVERFHGLERGDSVELLLHLHRYQVARAFAPGLRVLDVGCGDGYGCALLGTVASSVVGVDYDEIAVTEARRKYRQPGLRFVQGRLPGADLPPGAFDLITCFEMLEHIPEGEQDPLLDDLARVLAPGGVLLLSTPNRDVKERHYARFPEWRNPYHVHELSAGELRALLGRHFVHVSIVPQVIEVGSVLGLEGARPPPVSAEHAWVNLALAGQQPLVWPADTPFAALPRRMLLFEDTLAHNRQLLEEIDRLTATLLKARQDTEATHLKLRDAQKEAGAAREETERTERALRILQESLAVRASRALDYFPRVKRVLISVGHRVAGSG